MAGCMEDRPHGGRGFMESHAGFRSGVQVSNVYPGAEINVHPHLANRTLDKVLRQHADRADAQFARGIGG